jgi:hypothetical protein
MFPNIYKYYHRVQFPSNSTSHFRNVETSLGYYFAKNFTRTFPAGVTETKGASRGSYYPVLPAYGKMRENVVNPNRSSRQLNEIPWPRDIG